MITYESSEGKSAVDVSGRLYQSVVHPVTINGVRGCIVLVKDKLDGVYMARVEVYNDGYPFGVHAAYNVKGLSAASVVRGIDRMLRAFEAHFVGCSANWPDVDDRCYNLTSKGKGYN